jgi:hypothetical protein
VRRFLSHEWTLVAAGSVLLAVLMTWPTLRDPLHTLPGDLWDPALLTWAMAWEGWAVTHHPGALWDGNAFHSEHYGLAYSDTLLGYLPISVIGHGMPAAILKYNIIFVLVFALACFGAYMLVRQLGSGVPGAMLAGAAFAYAPWRWTQAYHLHVLQTGGIALALAMLARGHGYSLRHGRRPELVRRGWILAGWLVAAWQMTLGFGVGLQFGYVLGLIMLVALIRRALVRIDAIGIAVFVAVSAAMAYPYLKMISLYPYGRRGYADVRFFSPSVQGFVTAPNTDWLWSRPTAPLRAWLLHGHGGWEAVLLPGFVVYALAAAGLVLSVWSRRQRLLLAAALLVAGVLAMGLRAPVTVPYRVLFTVAPGWDAVRTPGRLIVWITLLLAVLAAGALTAIDERLRARVPARVRVPRRLAAAVLAAALAVPGALVLLEGVQQMPVPKVPLPPVSFAELQGPVLVLPSNYKDDELTMLWSTDGFVSLVNGSSGLLPAGLAETRRVTATFPDRASVDRLRGLGVRTVLVLLDPNAAKLPVTLPGTALPPNVRTASLDGLGITRDDRPGALIFHL